MLSIADTINGTLNPVLEAAVLTVGADLRCGAGLRYIIGSSKRAKILESILGRKTAWDIEIRQDDMFRKSSAYHEWMMNCDNVRMLLQNRRNIVITNEMAARVSTIEAIMSVLSRTFVDIEENTHLKISTHLNENPNVKKFLTTLFMLPTEYRIDILGGIPSQFAEEDIFQYFQDACKDFCKNLTNMHLPMVKYIDADGTDKDFGMYILLQPGEDFIKEAKKVGYKDPNEFV